MRSRFPAIVAPAVAAFIAASTMAAAQARPDVSLMFRGTPTHTGVASARLFDGQGGVKWRFATHSAVRSTPAVTATRVFIGSGDSTLYALDRASGKLIWKFDAHGPVPQPIMSTRLLEIASPSPVPP